MKKLGIIALVVAVVFVYFIFGTPHKPINDGLIVFTQIPSNNAADELFPENGRIVSVNAQYPGDIQILSTGFKSARSPQVSFDGSTLLFSGKLEGSQFWQIWEIDLGTREKTQITNQEANCTDPAYLPDGSILFSEETGNAGIWQGFALYKINPQKVVERITFHPHSDLMTSVTMDGRIVTVSSQVFPEASSPKFLAMRPDGTKGSLYYKGLDGYLLTSRGYETNDGHFVFIEKNGPGKLVRIAQNRPLHSRELIDGQGDYYSVYPGQNSQLIVSYRGDDSASFGIFTLDQSKNENPSLIYTDPDFHSIEAVSTKSRDIPRKLPTRVDPNLNSGRLLCMNSTITDLAPEEGKQTHYIQVSSINETLGTVKVEQDGSFYIEVTADKPVRFQALDESGNKILAPSSWVWVRPNESRGCVGCHEDRELAPDNAVPLAIKNEPVSFVDLQNPIAGK